MKARSAFVLAALFILAGCLGIALFLFARSSPAGNIDKATLSTLAHLPSFSAEIYFDFSTIAGFRGEKIDDLAEAARLQKQLKGDPSDVERYLLMGRHHCKVKREKEATEAFNKAVALCRQQVCERPGNMSWLARLGDALTHQGEMKEAEKLLRRVVKEAPNEWRGWLGMAEWVDDQSFRAIFGDKPWFFSFRGEKFSLPALNERKPTEKQIVEMRRLWQQARPLFDRAIELAPPDETKPYLRRIASSMKHAAVEAGFRAIAGENVHPMTVLLAPENIPDMRRIARLLPDDPQTVGPAMLFETLSCASQNKLQMREEPSSWADYRAMGNRLLVDVMPLESREFVLWCLERLVQPTTNPNKDMAAAASEILADGLAAIKKVGEGANASRPDSSRSRAITEKLLELLNRAVRLDPSHERAWDLLMVMLLCQYRIEETIAIACQRVSFQDNARNRLLLAVAYEYDHQFDKAAEALRGGLKNDPKDLNCLLGLIALALRRYDGQSLQQAGEQLEAIAPRIKAEKDKRHELDYLSLKGIHYALTDRPGRAKAAFQQVLKMKKGDPSATRGLVALGRPLTPAEQQLAIDYVMGQGGEVVCRNRRTNSPTGNARLINSLNDGTLGIGRDSESNGRQADSPVESIYLNNTQFVDADLFVLSAFPKFRMLSLSDSLMTDDGLTHLAHLTDLQSLDLSDTQITDRGLIRLKALRGVRSLSLGGTKITDSGLAHLKAFPKLEILRLVGLSNNTGKVTITDAGLVHLRNLSKLQTVTLGPSITDKGLAHLAAIPHLRQLMLLGSQITDEGMRRIGLLGELQELWLSSTKITDAGLIHLKGLHNLKRLHLGGTRITDAGLAHLKALSRLEELELDGTAISDAGLVHLSGLTNLRKLNLSDSGRKITDSTAATKPLLTGAGLKHLNGLTELKHLELAGRPITDAGLNNVEKFAKLEYLSLSMTNITDAGLERLHSLKQMSLMNVRDTKSTLQGVAELRKSLPKLEVYR